MRLYHVVKIEYGHTAMNDQQVQGQQAQGGQMPAQTHNAVFYGSGYSLEGAIADAQDGLKDFLRRMTAEAGPRETH